MERRTKTWNVGYNDEGEVPKPVALWQKLVHLPGIYDIEVDTSVLSPEECAKLISRDLEEGQPQTAFQLIKNLENE